MKRLALLGLASLLLLAACGGSGGGSSADTRAVSEIKADWNAFFSPKTTISRKDALLQDGKKFAPVVQLFESNPAARSVKLLIKSVTLQGPNRAKVVYVVKVPGFTLPQEIGYSVKQHGRWEIEDQTLCNLIEVGGTAPAQCTK